MYYLEIPSDQVPEIPLNLYLGFNQDVDFCVWVLTIDGLKSAPFDQHEAGNRCLQNLGLTVEQWQQWIFRVVVWQDPRLVWNQKVTPSELNANTTLEISQFELDHDRFVRDQYEGAIALLPDDMSLEKEGTAVALWQGSVEIAQQLQALWQEYQSQVRPSARIQWMTQHNYDAIVEQIQSFKSTLPLLDLHFVRYPQVRSCPCTPIAGILSISDDATVQAVEEQVYAISQQLS